MDLEKYEIEAYLSLCKIFLDKMPKNELFNYIKNKENADYYIEWRDFIGKYLKKEISWSTSIGILETMDYLIEEAKGNDNFRIYKKDLKNDN